MGQSLIWNWRANQCSHRQGWGASEAKEIDITMKVQVFLPNLSRHVTNLQVSKFVMHRHIPHIILNYIQFSWDRYQKIMSRANMSDTGCPKSNYNESKTIKILTKKWLYYLFELKKPFSPPFPLKNDILFAQFATFSPIFSISHPEILFRSTSFTSLAFLFRNPAIKAVSIKASPILIQCYEQCT